ncbi:Xaa-Pro aminopeptidase [bacterium (candidate division B38) B3_B38]|nr:MAG: Xaa-Pro aminopeptidase [bacterium (candidate division B38) B3_B38]
MRKLKKTLLTLLAINIVTVASVSLADEPPAILSMRERAQVIDRLLLTRLETVLPQEMREHNFDMWLVICRETNEDPVFRTLSPEDPWAMRRLGMMVFYDRGAKEGVERIIIAKHNKKLYRNEWRRLEESQWESLARVVAERDPQRIAINQSERMWHADGLSATLKRKLVEALGPKYTARLHSGEELAIGWLERRIPEEMEIYSHVVSIAHHIVAEAFSSRVITPGVTTSYDLSWWLRERFRELKLIATFQPDIDIIRNKTGGNAPEDNVIRRGDVLHCDIGFEYLRMCTDIQELGYVLRDGETDAPEGLKRALQMGNRLQDILCEEIKEGRTGNEVQAAALKKGREEGLNPKVYSHPIGFHLHAAGPVFGLPELQNGVPGRGDFPVHYDTCYAIELSIGAEIAEWGGQQVRFSLEEEAIFTREGVFFFAGRQTDFHLIK